MPYIDEAFLRNLKAKLEASTSDSDSGVVGEPSNHDMTSVASHEICMPDREENVSSDESTTLKAAFKKIERLCAVREQSSKALRDRLVREDFDPRAVDAALARALACGLLDDMRFADVLIRTRLSAGKGMMGIEAELARFDIEASRVAGWPLEYGVSLEGEIDRALLFLQRKPPHTKNLRDAAYRKLISKGYSSSVASSAARLWFESLPVSRD